MDIIKSYDPRYKAEMLKKKAAEDSSINNGQQVAAVEEDPLVILK